MGYAATSVESYLKKHPMEVQQYVFMREDIRTRERGAGGEAVISAGTRTTKDNKPEMIEKFGTLLRNGQVRFHKNFTSAHLDRLAPDMALPREHIVSELKGLQREVIYKKSKDGQAYMRSVVNYRTRNGADHDDFAMVSAINPYQIELFKINPVYRDQRQRMR